MAGHNGIAQYEDGILDLLASAGVTKAEIEANGTYDKIVHAFMKGVDFEVAARAILHQHGVEVVDDEDEQTA